MVLKQAVNCIDVTTLNYIAQQKLDLFEINTKKNLSKMKTRENNFSTPASLKRLSTQS